MTIAFVVPCYNEAQRTDFSKFKSWIEANPGIELFFVNDGSTDNTLEVLKAHFDGSQIINLEENQGKAEAVRLGMKELLQKNYSHIGFFDGDMATPLSELSSFQQMASEGRQVILGSRILRLGGNVKRKWYRHYLGRIFATVASMLLDLPVYDTQCGAKLFSTKALTNILDTPFISKWIFDVELLFRLKSDSTLKIEDYYEIPLSSWEDIGGSRLKIADFLKAPFELLQLYRRYS